MPSNEETTDTDLVPRAVSQAARASGLVFGGGLATVLTGPFGTILAPLIGHLAGELAAWGAGAAFTPLEKSRVDTAVQAAANVVENQEEQQQHARRDDFFAASDGGIPWGAELLEAAIKAAARDHESRKALHLGRFWANVIYDDAIDLATATFLLQKAREATYRQFVLLALFGRGDEEPWSQRLMDAGIANAEGETSIAFSLRRDVQDLAEEGLVGVAQHDGRVTATYAQLEGNVLDGDATGRVRLTDVGTQLARLLSLDLIPQGEFEPVFAELGR